MTTIRSRPWARPAHRQQGAVLAITLMMLLVLTLLGVTAVQLSTLQDKIAGNTRDMELAFEAAEAALRAGERDASGTVPATFGTGGWYRFGDSFASAPTTRAPDWSVPANWSTADTLDYTLGDDLWDVASAPAYAIEELPPLPPDNLEAGAPLPAPSLYRVTARGVGASGRTAVVVQSTYRR